MDYDSKLIKDIVPSRLYFGGVRDGKNQQKTIYMSRKESSNDPAHNLAFQLAPNHRDFVPRAKFGVDKLQEDNQNPWKRSISLTMEDPDLLPFLTAVEDTVVEMAVARSEELWGKGMDEAQVRDRLQSVIKPSPSDSMALKPMAKVKLNLLNPDKPVDQQPKPTMVCVVDNEIAPCEEYPKGKLEMHQSSDPVQAIERNSRVLASVKCTSVWKSGFGFGISLQMTHAIVWPHVSSSGVHDWMHLDGAVTVVTPAAKRTHEDAFDADLMEQ